MDTHSPQVDVTDKISCVPRFYLNESHKKQVKHALAGQAEQPKMSHAKAAEQYNRIMKHAPTAIDPTKPIAPSPKSE